MCIIMETINYTAPLSMVSKVHNKRKEGEYSTLTIYCTNALRKVHMVNHQVFLFCINTFRITEDLIIDANSFVVLCV